MISAKNMHLVLVLLAVISSARRLKSCHYNPVNSLNPVPPANPVNLNQAPEEPEISHQDVLQALMDINSYDFIHGKVQLNKGGQSHWDVKESSVIMPWEEHFYNGSGRRVASVEVVFPRSLPCTTPRIFYGMKQIDSFNNADRWIFVQAKDASSTGFTMVYTFTGHTRVWSLYVHYTAFC